MNGWSKHSGTAISLPVNSVDTDQLIPARFMSQPRKAGYAKFLFHDLRQMANGQPDPDFSLNRHPDASVLVAGHNFGTGSSREAAVYALVDAGIQVVVSSGFADIFAANAVNNGLLPACVSESELRVLQTALGENTLPVVVDISTSTITIQEKIFGYVLDVNAQEKLLNGWDDIDLTQTQFDIINRFSKQRYIEHAWAVPRSNHTDV